MLKRELVFHGFQATWWMLFCTASVLTAVVLIVLLMRYERRLVPARIGNMLMALRLAILGLVLFTLLEPVISWTLDLSRQGRIVVGVDLSQSMETADNHASPAEKLRWARALGMIGNSATDAMLDRWSQALESDEEPVWVTAEEIPDAQDRRELAQVRRENLQGLFDELDQLSRKEIAWRLLTGTQSPLLSELQELGSVALMGFAGRTETADEETFPQLMDAPPMSLETGSSDLHQILAATASGASDEETASLAAILLLTDGRDNAGQSPIEAADRLGQLSVPVFPVLLGSELKPKDLAIAALDYPQTVFKDDRPLLRATLNTSGFEGEQIAVHLEREGAEPIVKTVSPQSATATVEFPLESSELGRYEYTLRTDEYPGETRTDNNSKSFAMNVVDDKMHVLLLEEEARWEFRFLDNALTRDKRVEVEQVLFQQPYLGVLPETYFPRRLSLPADASAVEQSPFTAKDLIVLGDVDPIHLPTTAWELLEQFVAEEGGTLVLTAGKRFFPRRYRSPIVDRLLPITNVRPFQLSGPSGLRPPSERGLRLTLTPDGEREPMFQFSVDRVENREIWSSLPGHSWGLLGDAKPGASVLALASPPDQEPDLEAERAQAVIVHQHFGFGQVYWIGIDSTWRWRHRVGDDYHHRFWGQLARQAAENKAMAGNEFVKFGPERSDIEIGEAAQFRVRWTPSFFKQNPGLKAKIELIRTGEPDAAQPFSELELQAVEGQPFLQEARAIALPGGDYLARLIVEGANRPIEPLEAPLYVQEKQTLELSDLSSNRDLLSQVADRSGGRLLLPDQIRDVLELLRPEAQSTALSREIPLWDHWLIMVLFFALLTTEWVIRKLNGLP